VRGRHLADGRRATAVDTRGTTTYAYDSRRRLVGETYPDGRALTFAYDAHGEHTGITAKIGTQSLTTTTGYDGAGRPNKVTDLTGRGFQVAYDGAGNRTSLSYPNGTSTSYRYDALNRVTNISTVQGTAGPTVGAVARNLRDQRWGVRRLHGLDAAPNCYQGGWASCCRKAFGTGVPPSTCGCMVPRYCFSGDD
jgi:YD repeat-containing protein